MATPLEVSSKFVQVGEHKVWRFEIVASVGDQQKKVEYTPFADETISPHTLAMLLRTLADVVEHHS